MAETLFFWVYGGIAFAVLMAGLIWSEVEESYIFDDQAINSVSFFLFAVFWPVGMVVCAAVVVLGLLVRVARWIAKKGRR